jgi:hypothetical protein
MRKIIAVVIAAAALDQPEGHSSELYPSIIDCKWVHDATLDAQKAVTP